MQRGKHPRVDGEIQDVARVRLCHEEKLNSIFLRLFGVVDFDGQSTLIGQQPPHPVTDFSTGLQASCIGPGDIPSKDGPR